MKNRLKKLYNKNRFAQTVLKPFVETYHYITRKRYSDEQHIRKDFKKSFGYDVDLDNPVTLNEKIQWLKINDRTELHTKCADKIAVREYVKSIVGEEYLIPVLLITKEVNDLNSDNLPDIPFIIKTTHDSASYKIVWDKHKVNWKDIRAYFKNRLNRDYYSLTKEWQYKNIEPKIIVEKLLLTDSGTTPDDYKFHCFHGKVKYIQLDLGRGSKHHARNWYDEKWEKAPFTWASDMGGYETNPNEENIPKPKKIDTLIQVAEKLSSSFLYCRVDLYEHNDKIYFGEITFHHDSGFRPIEPKEWDKKLGDMLQLPI